MPAELKGVRRLAGELPEATWPQGPVPQPLRVYADPAGHPFCMFVAATDPA